MLVQPPVAFQQSTQDAHGTAGDPNRSKQQLEMRERRTQMASVHIAQVRVYAACSLILAQSGCLWLI